MSTEGKGFGDSEGEISFKRKAVVAIVIILFGLVIATQVFANKLDYHPSLGHSLNGLYPPFNIILWRSSFRHQFPNQLAESVEIGIVASALLLTILLAAGLMRKYTARAARGIYGAARFANMKDLKKAGLLKNKGVYIGGITDPKTNEYHYLRDSSHTHLFVLAGSRAGKTAGFVVPTALSYPESLLVYDIKGEIWQLTAGWRKQHADNHVIRFDPASVTEQACWNPLDEIRVGTPNETKDIQNLCEIVVDPEGKGKDHWGETSYSLLMGCVAHVLYKRINEGTPATLSAVDTLLTGYRLEEYYSDNRQGCLPRPMKEVWQELIEYKHCDGCTNELAAKAGKDQADRPDNEGASVLSTAKSFLSVYRDPILARNTSKSHFLIRDLNSQEKPVSIYVCVLPNDIDRLRPILRVFFTMVVHKLTEQGPVIGDTKPYKHRVAALFDELASLGKMEILVKAASYMAGYGVFFYFIAQDMAQIYKLYGKPDPITPNCMTTIALPTGNLETAKYLSELSGETTHIKRSTTNSGKMGGSWLLSQFSTSFVEVKGFLLTPDDIMRTKLVGPERNDDGYITKPGNVLIFHTGVPPILGTQPLYFTDPIFTKRAAIPPPAVSDRLYTPETEYEKVKIEYEDDK